MNILTSISVFALSAIVASVNSYFESCIGERCFAMSWLNETKNFNDGKKWCKDMSYNLAVVNDYTTQKALSEFLNSAQPKEQLFIDLQLQKIDANTWYLLNGSRYLGGLIEQNAANYQLYGYLKTHWNTFYADGSKPNDLRSFICEFEKSRCSINSSDFYNYKERCFIKYEKENLTWYRAREICQNTDGDLAIFNYASGTPNWPNPIPFDTAWLDTVLSYWVGIRYNNWRWTTSGNDDEVIYTMWSDGYPKTYGYGCVCVDPRGDPSWSWVDCSCDEPRQFVCLKIVPTTTSTITTTTSPTTTSKTTSMPFANNMTNNPSSALAIGLGAGIGGGVFLILLIVIIVVAVTLTRKRRRKNNGVESRREDENTRTATTSNTEHEASDTSEFYAHIVPTTQHPANTKAQNDVIYAKPEFPNSTPSGPGPNSILQGRVKSIMLEGPSDFYANAASVS